MKKKSIVIWRFCMLLLLVSDKMIQPGQAIYHVIDESNLRQNIVAAAQTVAAVKKQIEQYKTQLQQYENMLQNTMGSTDHIWDQAQATINKLLQAQETLNYYKNQAGSLDAYLSRYHDINYYQTSPCFTSQGCTDAERQVLLEARAQGSEAQKRANDAVLKGVDQQQQTLTKDAANLTRLQTKATTAQGQMQALQAANQLASAQTHQLLQIRGLLVAQENAAATRAQVKADREAQQEAASQQIRSWRFKKSSEKSWRIEDGVGK